MNKKLPNKISPKKKIFGFIFLFLLGIIFSVKLVGPVYAAPGDTPTPTPPPAATPTNAPISNGSTQNVDGQWVEDAEVTFVGKTASRADSFLKWTLRNYSWLCMKTVTQNQCDNTGDPLVDFWRIIRNIVYALMALFVLGTAFILIITRGQNMTVMKFLPRFFMIIILVTLSFSLVQFIYQVSDVIQGFFLGVPNPTTHQVDYISTKDLLYMGFDYAGFKGLRIHGYQYEESAFISLLLVRLTAITYYVMTGVLIVRKIILWFFIVISPVFPLLLFYKPIRNTAKIWIGEFFRWLLYAPLFAIFLRGLVEVWRKGIPLPFAPTDPSGPVIYPTAINILLGGPGESIFYNSPISSNSVNLSDTFAKYVVALIMLWVVILLPFLLLKIFLDYINTLSFGSNSTIKQFVDRGMGFFNPKGIPPTPAPTPPGLVSPAGNARSMPFLTHKGATISEPIAIKADIQASVRESNSVLQLANLSIPKMRDIARFETSMMSNDITRKHEAQELHSTLTKIANPTVAALPSERQKFTTVRQQLLEQKQKGNPIASSVLNASQVSATNKAVTQADQKQQQMNQAVSKLSQPASLPSVNKVQQVSLDDYEEVRKLWTENYQTIEPPKDLSGQQMDRSQWIKNDIDRITQAIALLNSQEPDKVNQGMNMVANILPFLLIGGFSKSEVVAYLKAKMEAGKSVLSSNQKKEEEEESMLSAKHETTTEGAAHMAEEAKIETPLEENPAFSDEQPSQAIKEELEKPKI